MLKLKESFRYQNAIDNMLREAFIEVSMSKFSKETTKHLLSSAGIGEDFSEVNEKLQERKFEATHSQTVDFIQILLGEKEKLSFAISNAKKHMESDLDVLKTLNSNMAEIIRVINIPLNKQLVSTVKGSQRKYGKDADGRQVQFVYDTETVKEYDIDKTMLRAVIKRLQNSIDENSLKIDVALSTVEVDYTPLFDHFDTIEEAFRCAQNKSKAK